AWVIWDPYYAAAEISLNARLVADATGLAANVAFYIATRKIAEENPKVLESVLSAIDEIDGWIKVNQKQYAAELSPKIGLPVDVIERSVGRAEFGARRVDAATLVEQQKIADTFTRLQLIPKSIVVKDAAWKAEF
ncbi:MAG: sulfonate ABC transporter substrate-binding protein, partial [Bradyrhizobium sp.]